MKRVGKLRLAKRTEWKEKLDEKIYSSVIAKRFRRFTNWLYSFLINGFFGKVFTAYSAEEELFFNSRFIRAFRRGNRGRRMVSDIRAGIAKAFESSRILMAISGLMSSLIHRKLKTYGAFLLSLGAYGIVAYIIRVYVLESGGEDFSVLFLCFAFIILALPMMASRETFASATHKSQIMNLILFTWLGIPRDSFTIERKFPKRYTLVTAAGMVLGALTYFFHPVYYVLFAFSLLVIALVFTYPEIGILGLIAAVPVSAFSKHPSIMLFGSVLMISAGYCVKLMRGKRVIKLNLIDFSILAFSIVFLLGGILGAGGRASLYSATLYFSLIMGYFLTVNLIRTKEWVRRCVSTFLLFASISAVFGAVQIFTGSLDASWIDSEMFSDIRVRITSTFDNPNTFATYLLLVIPFVFAVLLRRDFSSKRIPATICLVSLAVCLIETWSRGAWLGMLVAIALFFLIYSRRSLGYLFLCGALLPAGSMFLPDNIVARFISIGSASDTSSMYRISAWRGVMKMLRENWLSGVGVGESSFMAVYPAFSYAGIEGIRHAHNLYLQLLSETGIAGLITFIAVLVLFVQNCFEYIHIMRNQDETVFVIAGLVSVVATLIMGLTDYIWYSSRVFLMFWIVIGLVNACVRIGLAEFHRSNNYETNSVYSVNFDLNVDNL